MKLARVLRVPSREGFREIIQLRGIPPHPQALSRVGVGARGADFCRATRKNKTRKVSP